MGGGGGIPGWEKIFDVHWSTFKVKVTCKLGVARTAKPGPIENKITNSMAATEMKFKVGHKGMSPETPRCLLAHSSRPPKDKKMHYGYYIFIIITTRYKCDY